MGSLGCKGGRCKTRHGPNKGKTRPQQGYRTFHKLWGRAGWFLKDVVVFGLVGGLAAQRGSSAQLGPHLGLFPVKLQRTRPYKPKKNIPISKNIMFSYLSLNQEHQQPWGGLGFDIMAGWAKGAAARPALAARP